MAVAEKKSEEPKESTTPKKAVRTPAATRGVKLGAKSAAKALEDKLTAAVRRSIDAVAERRAAGPAEDFCLRPVNPVRIVVAFSGGRDSAALVEILAKLFHRPHQTAIADITVVHVHHGLSPNANAWVEHAQTMCEAWKLPLVVERVFVNKALGTGVEAAAREARYRVLEKVARAKKADVIMTAHHRDDRIETFLIQWMRGAGPEGLAAMSTIRTIESAAAGDRLVLARPWLDVTRSEIDAFVKKMKIKYVEDESNADTHYLRNLLRNKVLPLMDEARPGWRQAAARSVVLVEQSADVMKSVGAEDVARCLDKMGHALVISKLLNLPLARQALAMRSWLAAEGVRPPSKVRLYEALRQVRETHSDSRLTIRCDGREIRRWGANLVLRTIETAPRGVSRDITIQWQGQAEVSLGLWGGVLRFESCSATEDGFDAQLLRSSPLFVKARKGGEKIKLHPLRPSRNLKYLYQAANIAAFERVSLPLVWFGNRVIFAAGLGSDVRCMADKDLVHERVRLVWVPDKPLISV